MIHPRIQKENREKISNWFDKQKQELQQKQQEAAQQQADDEAQVKKEIELKKAENN